MNKITITKTLKEINEYFRQMNEADLTDFYAIIDYDKKNDAFMIGALIDADREFKTIIPNTKELDLYGLLKLIISEVYENRINWRNKTVKSYNNFLRRKAKQLELWTSRKNDIKIKSIIKEITEMHKEVEVKKNEVAVWKDLIRLLYRAKETYCPQKTNEKQEILKQILKLREKLELM